MEFQEMLELYRACCEAGTPDESKKPFWLYRSVDLPGELEEEIWVRYPFRRLVSMPLGWRRGFGLEMHEDLRTVLLALGGEEMLHDYRVRDVKEKYGELVWTAGLPYGWGWGDEPGNMTAAGWLLCVSEFYCAASEHICVRCGGVDDVRQSTGWINPVCPCDIRWEDGTPLDRPARDEPFCTWWTSTGPDYNRKDMVVGADAPIVRELGLPAPLHATELWNRLAL